MLRKLCEQEPAAVGTLLNAQDFVRGLMMARIGDPPSLTQLAERARYRLGYSDAASFSTAFKRWTGKSPSDFRKSVTRTLGRRRVVH